MRSASHSTSPSPSPTPRLPDLDLEVYSEATRRALYDLVVAVHFQPPAEPSPADCYPDYSPDQAGLTVFFAFHRWLASWSRLEEAGSDLPPSRRHALVRIQAAPEAPHGVMFYEI